MYFKEKVVDKLKYRVFKSEGTGSQHGYYQGNYLWKVNFNIKKKFGNKNNEILKIRIATCNIIANKSLILKWKQSETTKLIFQE